ncbi:MAG: DNA-formamidopyrimidine glycosylase [Parachlamydiaceae bacterium]|nr:DNA-formamidopyrimidine glycosylase [Parachlamydiaceae bacterium]
MPELPEVETIVNELRSSSLIGMEIIETKILWPGTISSLDPEEFIDQLVGQKILEINRRGKYIVFTLSKHTLFVHLRMTGKFTLCSSARLPFSHERVSLKFKDGRYLYYDDQRKFGKWLLLLHPEEKLASLGVEPLSPNFSLHVFKTILQASSQAIKPFLLNQQHIAGIGNIYVDEALWAAKIHPMQKACALTPSMIKKLFKAIPEVLKAGIENMGTSLGSKDANYFSVSGRRGDHQHQLKVFRRNGFFCPRCGTTIIKIKVAQRGTHICPTCQSI